MNVFAQVDNNIVTAILQALAAPTVLPVGRIFVDITALPNKDIIGWTYDGATFHPPNEAVTLPSGVERIVSKLGA
jgi:hypothetical protein